MLFFFLKQMTAYEVSACLVGSEMCIRGRSRYSVRQLQVLLLLRSVGDALEAVVDDHVRACMGGG